jgi:PadR family transcriptional regulator, regulatory protein PadR
MVERLSREFTMAFWKAHVLHHAAEHPIYGLWLLEELAGHGYRTSPGTLYPMLVRMERNGLLRSTASATAKSRRSYVITPAGRQALRLLREKIAELHREVVVEARASRKRKPRRGDSE